MNSIQSLCEPRQSNVLQLEQLLGEEMSRFGGSLPECHTVTSKKVDAAHAARIAPVYRALQTRSPEANFALYMNRDVNMVLFLRRWRAQVHFRMSSDGCRLQVADIVPSGVDDKRPEFATVDEASAYIERMMSL